MTDAERDQVLTGLAQLVLSLKARVDDYAVQIAALRSVAQRLLPATEAELDQLVEIFREKVKAATHQSSEDVANEALRRWLENYDGPIQ